MLRKIFLSTAVAATFAALPATAQTVRGDSSNSFVGNVSSQRVTASAYDGQPWQPSQQMIVQTQRWAAVGRCVVAADPTGSLAFVNARRGSGEAAAAARQLDPIFDRCSQGIRLKLRGNAAMRRAALADALR